MRLFRLYILILSALVAVSCNSEKFAEFNLSQNELSLSCKDQVLIYYTSGEWQYSCNTSNNHYRVNDDTMGRYFILKCSERPTSTGQTIYADLEYTTANNTVSESGLLFEVQKTDDSGRVWLWNKKKKYGIVIKQL